MNNLPTLLGQQDFHAEHSDMLAAARDGLTIDPVVVEALRLLEKFTEQARRNMIAAGIVTAEDLAAAAKAPHVASELARAAVRRHAGAMVEAINAAIDDIQPARDPVAPMFREPFAPGEGPPNYAKLQAQEERRRQISRLRKKEEDARKALGSLATGIYNT